MNNDFTTMTTNMNITTEELLQRLDDEYALHNLPTMIFLGLLMSLGFFGNILVFFVYLTQIKPSTTRCFIMALSFLDFVTCSVCIPIDIVDLRYNFTFGDSAIVFCKISAIVAFTSFASGYILIAVAAERYKKICTPTHGQITIKAAEICVFVSCIAAVLGSIPGFVLYGKHTTDKFVEGITVNATLCTTSDKYIDTAFPLINNGVQFAIFVAATSTIVILYTFIWKKVVRLAGRKKWSWRLHESSDNTSFTSKQDAEGKANEGNAQKDYTLEPTTDTLSQKIKQASTVKKIDSKRYPSKRQTSARRTTLMLFMITLTFIVSYLPHLSLMAAREIHWGEIENLTGLGLAVYNVFLRSYFINSAVNPLIYSYCNINVRNGVKALIS